MDAARYPNCMEHAEESHTGPICCPCRRSKKPLWSSVVYFTKYKCAPMSGRQVVMTTRRQMKRIHLFRKISSLSPLPGWRKRNLLRITWVQWCFLVPQRKIHQASLYDVLKWLAIKQPPHSLNYSMNTSEKIWYVLPDTHNLANNRHMRPTNNTIKWMTCLCYLLNMLFVCLFLCLFCFAFVCLLFVLLSVCCLFVFLNFMHDTVQSVMRNQCCPYCFKTATLTWHEPWRPETLTTRRFAQQLV